jgi:putative oxidoreductase
MGVVFPELLRFSDVGLLALRVMVASEFLPSGWAKLKDPVGKAKQNGLSPAFTTFIGAAEVLGSLGLIFGILIQLAALGLIVIMLGAIQKKIFVWHTGYWGKENEGWHYDLMLLVMSLVIVVTGGGRLVLF